MTVVITLLSTLPVLLAGDFCQQRLTPTRRAALGERWSVALALGAGFIALLNFGLSLIDHASALTITIGLTLIVAFSHLWQQRLALKAWWEKRPFTTTSASTWIMIIVALLFFTVVYAISQQARLGHDGYAFWGYKAKVIFIEGGWPAPTGRFATLPHPDYPLLVSTFQAWVYWFLGDVDETAVKFIFVLFYAALTLLFYETVRQQYGLFLSLCFTGLMALTPQLAAVSALSGYADVALMLYVWGTAVFCQRWFNKGNQHDLLLGGVLAALAFWVKREGAVYWLINGVLIALFLLWRMAKHQDKRLSETTYFLLPALLIMVPWLLYLNWWHIPNSDFATFSLSNVGEYINRLPIILTLLGHQLFLAVERWGLLWWLFIFSTAHTWRRSFSHWHLMLLIILPIALLNFAFVLSSWEPFSTHIAVSIERLILPTVPLAWYFIALQATGLTQWLTNMRQQA